MMITLLKKKILLNKFFLPKKWLNILFLKKYSKVRNEITQTIEKYNKESYSTQSKIGQNALVQSKIFEQTIFTLGDFIEKMHILIEHKDNKIELLENEIGLPDCKDIGENRRLGLNKISSKRKVIGLWID